MNTRKSRFISIGLFLATFVCGYWLLKGNHSSPENTELVSGPATGAKLSLDYISLARSYPGSEIPKQGFYQAHEDVKALQLQAKLKGKPEQVWDAMGPTNIGGRTLALAIHPEDPNIVFAGSASGGLWKSTSAGCGDNAWEYVHTGFPVLGVSTIVIDENNPDLMYIGTGESYGAPEAMPGVGPVRTTRGSYGIGILKSTDGGQTWEKSLDWSLDQRRTVQKLLINPQRSESVWAATSEGTYRSFDGGQTWNLVHEAIMATDIVMNHEDTSFVHIAAGGLGSVDHGVYRSVQGGIGFYKLTFWDVGGPLSFSGKAVLAISESDPEVVMVSIGESNGDTSSEGGHTTWLMRSVDNGLTWALVHVSGGVYASFQGWYSHAIGIQPENSNTVWATGQPQAIYLSYNGGIGLFSLAPPAIVLPGEEDDDDVYPVLNNWADHHDIVFHPTDPNIIYFVNDGGIFRTTNAGGTLENCNSGYQTVQFYNGVSTSTSSPDLFLGGLQDNNSIIYEGELDWRRGWAGDGAWTALNQQDNNIAYLSAQYGQAVRSSSLFTENKYGDESIRPDFDAFPSEEANFITPYVLSPADNTTIYMGGEKIYKSLNGVDWTTTNSGLKLDGNGMSAMAASHQSEDVVYVASSPRVTRANVYKTVNGGGSWQKITGSLPDRFPTDIAVDPTNDENVFVTFAGFDTSHVFKSIDGGQTWIDIGEGLPDIPTWSVTVDPEYPNHIFVGNEVGVYQSLDGGANWENINGNLPDAVFAMDLIVSHSNRKLRVATHGNGAYETDLPLPISTEEEADEPASFELNQNYPNPFNPRTLITYSLHQRSPVRLEVFDVNGRLIRTLVNEVQSEGEFEVVFDAGGLASGTYIYSISVDGEVSTKAMTLIK